MLTHTQKRAVLIALAFIVSACDDSEPAAGNTSDHDHEHTHDAAPARDAGSSANDDDGYAWNLPPGFPKPFLPDDDPMTTEKVELGRHLFYDKRLSDNQTYACANCHKQELAFTDGRTTGLGSTGQLHTRNAMSLTNIAYSVSLTWANPLYAMGVMPEPLERQSELPMYGTSPIELGLTSAGELEDRLAAVPEYVAWFEAAFAGESEPLTAHNASRAIAAFERTLISGRSPYDRWMYDGDDGALSDSAKRGSDLFFGGDRASGDHLECFHCHAGFNFSDHVHYRGKSVIEVKYHNTGLYNIDGKGAYPEPNTGVFNVTGDPKDMGFFKVPTLRNVAVTAPYMHDGSIATLDEVLDHYMAGGRTITDGPNAGVGSASPLKDPLIQKFQLSADERSDLKAFLESLTDDEFLHDPAFADPWP